MLEIIDIMMRNAASGVFFFLGVLIIRDYGWRLGAVLAMLASFTAATYTICTQSWFNWDEANFFWVFAPFCILGPVHVWLFSLSQFEDNFTLKPVHIFLALLYLVLNDTIYSSFTPLTPGDVRLMVAGVDLLPAAYALLRLGFIVHMVYVAWQGRADDLLESRRKFRSTYIVLVSVAIFVILVMETFYTSAELRTPFISIIQASSFFVLSFIIFWHATKSRDGILVLNQTSTERRAQTEAHHQHMDAADKHDLAAVEKLMVEDRMFLEPGLTISKLAGAVALPEHRLRKLINQHLGYRNFADFLNRYRIEEAKLLLAEADKRHTQVLVIAMDLGYGSLGPFNRAFKARTGQTPTQYRKQALEENHPAAD